MSVGSLASASSSAAAGGRDSLTGLRDAFAFLTVLPLPGAAAGDDPVRMAEGLRRSSRWFWAVGVVVGGLVAAAAWCAGQGLGPWSAATLTVILWGGLSGGLHLDGLADSADGVLSHRPRERMLAIMRDSRIGAMGMLALLAVLGLKVALLAEMPGAALLPAAFLAPLAGRLAMVAGLVLAPYARREGIALLLYQGRRRRDAGAGVILLVGVAGGVMAWCGAGPWPGWGGCLAVAACVVWVVGGCRRRLGGMTGDTLGALNELAETAMLLGIRLALAGGAGFGA